MKQRNTIYCEVLMADTNCIFHRWVYANNNSRSIVFHLINFDCNSPLCMIRFYKIKELLPTQNIEVPYFCKVTVCELAVCLSNPDLRLVHTKRCELSALWSFFVCEEDQSADIANGTRNIWWERAIRRLPVHLFSLLMLQELSGPPPPRALQISVLGGTIWETTF